MCNEVNLIGLNPTFGDLECREYNEMERGQLNSSHGHIIFCTRTGEVIEVHEGCCDQCHSVVPVHVEVEEWKRTYPGSDEDIGAPAGHDILDFDVWMMVEDAIGDLMTTTGLPCAPVMEPHEESWRQEWRGGLR